MDKAIVFDTETTDKQSPEIIEAYYIGVKFGNPDGDKATLAHDTDIGVLNQRYKPEGKISMGAMATHHIMDEDLVGCPPSSSFRLPDGLEYMIGHKIDFDWVASGSPENVKQIDTLAISRVLWPECDSHGLNALMYFHDRENARAKVKDAHSAEVDVGNAVFILKKILEKVPKVQNMHDLYRLSQFCMIPKTMPFGKHAGLKFSEIPQDYKDWYLKQNDIDPWIKMAMENDAGELIDLLVGVIPDDEPSNSDDGGEQKPVSNPDDQNIPGRKRPGIRF